MNKRPERWNSPPLPRRSNHYPQWLVMLTGLALGMLLAFVFQWMFD